MNAPEAGMPPAPFGEVSGNEDDFRCRAGRLSAVRDWRLPPCWRCRPRHNSAPRRCRWLVRASLPAAKYASEGLTIEVRSPMPAEAAVSVVADGGGGFRGGGGGGFRGGGGGFHGGGFRGGGAAFHGGGFRGGGMAFRGGGIRYGGAAFRGGGYRAGAHLSRRRLSLQRLALWRLSPRLSPAALPSSAFSSPVLPAVLCAVLLLLLFLSAPLPDRLDLLWSATGSAGRGIAPIMAGVRLTGFTGELTRQSRETKQAPARAPVVHSAIDDHLIPMLDTPRA